MTPARRGSLGRDSIYYMAGKLAEGVVGIFALSFYTHAFPEADYGRYVVLNTVLTSLALIAVQSLLQSAVRYVNGYEQEGKGKVFYTTVLFSWLRLSAFLLIAGAAAAGSVTLLAGRFTPIDGLIEWFPVPWLWMAAGSLVTYAGAQFVLSLLAARRQIAAGLGLSLLGAVIRFLFPLALVTWRGAGVGVIFAAGLLADGLALLAGAWKLGLIFRPRRREHSPAIAREMRGYGMPLLGNMATNAVLNLSDRLLVAPLAGPGAGGIYAANYQIPAVSFNMLNIALARASYPNILKAWGEGDGEGARRLLSGAVRIYLIITLPAAVGLGVLARSVAGLVLAPEFAAGYPVILFVAGGMVFSGLVDYSNKYWELESKTGAIFRMSLLCGLFNVAANLSFITRFSYMAAAVSTFASFGLYFLISRLRSFRHMPWGLPFHVYARIGGAALAMGGLIWMAGRFLSGVLYVGAAVIGGAALYFALLYALGEIRGETRMVLDRLKKMARR